jgi:hypothetical protein
MQASPDRIAIVYCAGIAVIAFPGTEAAAGLAVAFVGCTWIAVIAVLGRMHAFSIFAGINGAGIVIIAIHGHMHTCAAIE